MFRTELNELSVNATLASRKKNSFYLTILNSICVTPTHYEYIHTAPQKSKQTQLEKLVTILSDLLWDHGPEPLPSQDPLIDRSWDLLSLN